MLKHYDISKSVELFFNHWHMIIKYLVYTNTIIIIFISFNMYFTSFSLKTNNANVSFLHLLKIQQIIYTADLDCFLEENHKKLWFFCTFYHVKIKRKTDYNIGNCRFCLISPFNVFLKTYREKNTWMIWFAYTQKNEILN